MKKILATLALTTSLVHGGITLDWEYAFNGATIGLPLHTFAIHTVKVAPTGHVALEIRNSAMNEPRQRRLLLLDPDGHETWLSDNLASFVGDMTTVRILHLAADSASFAVADDMTNQLKLLMYNKNATPDFSTRTLSGQRLAMVESEAAMQVLRTPTSFFGPNWIYTLETGSGPVMEGIGLALRRYRLDTLPTLDTLVQSVTGTDDTNFVIRWNSTLNVIYQVQMSSDMTIWTGVGQPITGNGDPVSWSTPIKAGAAFYRVTQR